MSIPNLELMELRHLTCFLAVLDTGSFTLAAQRAHLTQSGLSQQVQALERELGTTLFARRPVRPTPSALALEPHARSALAAASQARRAVAAAAGARLELRVGAIASLTAIDLCALLERVRLLHPNLSVTVIEKATDEMVEDVRDGRLDLTIVDTAHPSDPALESVTVCEETFCLTGPALPTGPVVPADLDGRTWVALRRGTRLRDVFNRLMEDQHLVPVVTAEVSDIRLLARLSAAGFGNAVLPAPMVLHCPSAPVPTAVLPPRTIRAVHRSRHDSPALSTCLSVLRDNTAPAG
mgnify:FL=1